MQRDQSQCRRDRLNEYNLRRDSQHTKNPCHKYKKLETGRDVLLPVRVLDQQCPRKTYSKEQIINSLISGHGCRRIKQFRGKSRIYLGTTCFPRQAFKARDLAMQQGQNANNGECYNILVSTDLSKCGMFAKPVRFIKTVPQGDQ